MKRIVLASIPCCVMFGYGLHVSTLVNYYLSLEGFQINSEWEWDEGDFEPAINSVFNFKTIRK